MDPTRMVRTINGSPHGGSLNMGLLFHCGDSATIVKFEVMLLRLIASIVWMPLTCSGSDHATDFGGSVKSPKPPTTLGEFDQTEPKKVDKKSNLQV